MGDESKETDHDTTGTGPWHPAITWSGFAVVALLVFELTRQPALGVATLCLKFGWQDFKTARWLRRFDPCQARGLACWWMYTGWGLLKVVLAAEAMTVLIGTMMILWITLAGKPVLANEIELAAVGACATLVVGIGLCFMTTLATVVVGYRHGFEVVGSPS